MNIADGRTALEVATDSSNWDAVHLLLEANADINAKYIGVF